jgi:hypothetical protein
MNELKLLGIVTIFIVLSACQTTSVKEEKLVITSGLFQQSNITTTLKPGRYGNEEWFETGDNGFRAGVIFVKTHGFGILKKRKMLSLFALKRWNRFKKSELRIGEETSITTPLGEIHTQRFYDGTRECFHFNHHFWRSSRDNQQRFTRGLSGYFCEKNNTKLSSNTMSDFLHQIGVTRHYDPRPNTTVENKTAENFQSSQSNQNQKSIKGTDKDVCRNALHADEIAWEGKYFQEYVKEAKDRNLTPQKCAELTGRLEVKTVSPSSVSITNDGISDEIDRRLEKLKSLIDKGLISEEEASQKRKEILEGL